MANIIDHSMEKTAAFIAKLQEYDFNYINSFRLCCLCNDIYLKDYNKMVKGEKMIIYLNKNRFKKKKILK